MNKIYDLIDNYEDTYYYNQEEKDNIATILKMLEGYSITEALQFLDACKNTIMRSEFVLPKSE